MSAAYRPEAQRASRALPFCQLLLAAFCTLYRLFTVELPELGNDLLLVLDFSLIVQILMPLLVAELLFSSA